MTAVELVLFFGPPFIGKTLYYHRHYSQTHSRIAASEIFEEDKCKNLRYVILKAVGLLSKGKSVVIDDENWFNVTRKSYSSLIKQKVPNCIFTIVQFIPDASFGHDQCLWNREWALVKWTMMESDHESRSLKLAACDEKLDCWFSRKRVTASTLNPPEFPVPTGEFSLVTVEPEFGCNTPYKFSLPGLFIQWESVIEDTNANSLSFKAGTVEFLNKWMSKNPCGRLVIIGPKLKHDKEILDKRIKLALLQLASQVTFPMYFTFVDVKHQLDQYSKLPQPGVLAFLQKFHTINLNHKSTIYVYHTNEHYKTASTVGIRTIKGEDLLRNSQLISAIYCGEITQTLPFLKKLQELNCISDKDQEQEPRIPFLSRARESSTPLVWKYCYGKVNGVCFKDKLILERYQTQYALAAKHAPPPDHPSLKTKADDKTTNNAPDIVNLAPSTPDLGSNIKSSFNLENVNLREVAETPGRYHGGFICKEKIFDYNTQVMDNQLKITSKCMASTSTTYDVEAILGESSGLVSAHCSCPDLASQTGRCKHVIGLLLNYQERNELTTSDGQRKRNDHKDTRKSNIKKPVSCKGRVNTLYCMSQDELLQTAKEILQKHQAPLVHHTAVMLSHEAGEPAVTPESNRTLVQEPQKTEGPEGPDSRDVLSLTDKTDVKRGSEGDELDELLFGDHIGTRRKKVCSERLCIFAEDTPPEKMPKDDTEQVSVSAIIPDSLVPETVSLVPETLVPETEQSALDSEPRETLKENSRNEERTTVKQYQSFEDFLDELM